MRYEFLLSSLAMLTTSHLVGDEPNDLEARLNEIVQAEPHVSIHLQEIAALKQQLQEIKAQMTEGKNQQAQVLQEKFDLLNTSIAQLSRLQDELIAESMEMTPPKEEVKPVDLTQKQMKKGGWGLFATAEWLYWKANEAGTEFAVEAKNPIAGTLTLTDARAKKIHFEMDSGYRLGVGYHFTKNGWDTS